MKIYFIYSKWILEEQLNLFLDYFKTTEHEIIFRKIAENPAAINISESTEIFEYNVNSIKRADIIIAECSYVSSEIGYDIAIALEQKKPVIALYNMTENTSDSRHIRNVPVGLKGNKNKYLFLKGYSFSKIEYLLSSTIKLSSESLCKKFNLILPPDIAAKLYTVSKLEDKSKSDIVRDALNIFFKNIGV